MSPLLTRAILALLITGATPAKADIAPRQLILVQDSGWMEPFLSAEGSQFRPFIEALAAAIRVPDGTIAIATFDQEGQVPGRMSPRILYAGPYAAAPIQSAVAAIDLPRKAGGQAYADADFNGALLGGIRRGLLGRDGVIWMVTNNKNAPGNSPAVERNTAAFYAALRDSPAITRIAAYPVRMPLKGRNFEASGFVVYGIGYGAGGQRALDAALSSGGLAALFRHPPVNLKPVLAGGVTLRFDKLDSGGLQAGLENGVLVVRGADAAAGTVLRLTGHLDNGLYPQRIVAARLILRWSASGPEAASARAGILPDRVANLPPQGESEALAVSLTLPPVPRPAGLGGLLSGRREVDGALTLQLTELRLDLDPAFLERVRLIFGSSLLIGDQMTGEVVAQNGTLEDRLPSLFRDYRSVSEAVVTLPVRIEARFSPWPLIAASTGALALLGIGFLGAAATGRPRTCTVMLGAFPKRAILRPFRTTILRAPDGSHWRVRATLWGPARAHRLAEVESGA